MSHDPNDPPRHLGGELVIPVMAVIFTLYYFSTIWNSPWTAQVSAFAIGGVLLFVCALFFVKVVGLLQRDEGRLTFGNLFSYDDIRTGRIGLLITTIGFCALIDRLGFTLTTFLFLWLSMAVLGQFKRLGLITVTSALMSLGGWAVFIWAFETRFPRGWFENTMRMVLANG
ncbi:tripartite tricarboxylate transporter TctB family protein [Marivita sp. S0852]|uniref:tripartite tricarboxylate transporter TctB family protein n=1 Tax=Marivita sp. S0852 TaxID=3373893 RepID=UPI003981DF8A